MTFIQFYDNLLNHKAEIIAENVIIPIEPSDGVPMTRYILIAAAAVAVIIGAKYFMGKKGFL